MFACTCVYVYNDIYIHLFQSLFYLISVAFDFFCWKFFLSWMFFSFCDTLAAFKIFYGLVFKNLSLLPHRLYKLFSLLACLSCACSYFLGYHSDSLLFIPCLIHEPTNSNLSDQIRISSPISLTRLKTHMFLYPWNVAQMTVYAPKNSFLYLHPIY